MIEILVYEVPGPQGSKRHVGGGRMIEQSQKVKPWREAVKHAALLNGSPRVTGPCAVDIVFTVRKPKSAPKKRRTWPDRKPDIDKYVRSTLDALVTVQTIEDDARVVRLAATKVFPGEGTRSLPSPGAVIRIWGIEQEEDGCQK